MCYFTTETIFGFNLECLKNEKVDDQKIEAGNIQTVLLAMALVQGPLGSCVGSVCLKLSELILPRLLASSRTTLSPADFAQWLSVNI